MTSFLYVGNVSDGTNSVSLSDVITGMAKFMIQYNTTYSPYDPSIEKSIGVSSVTDVQTGIQDFNTSLYLGTVVNGRPMLAGVSTDATADSFGYHSCLYRATGIYRFAYYTTGWAAAQYISCMGI